MKKSQTPLLKDRLDHYRIDAGYIDKQLYNMMQMNCLHCEAARQCAFDMLNEDYESGMSLYCPNAITIDDLLTNLK